MPLRILKYDFGVASDIADALASTVMQHGGWGTHRVMSGDVQVRDPERVTTTLVYRRGLE
jgi:hypothetical protein